MDCVFIIYSRNSKTCRFFVHKSNHTDIHDNTIMESYSVESFEHIYPYKNRLESSSGGLKNPEKNQKRMIPMKRVQEAINVK